MSKGKKRTNTNTFAQGGYQLLLVRNPRAGAPQRTQTKGSLPLASSRVKRTRAIHPRLLTHKSMTQRGHFLGAAAGDFCDVWRGCTLDVALTNAPILGHYGLAVISHILLRDFDLFDAEDRHYFQDLLLGALLLKIGQQILHSDSVRGQLRTATAINNFGGCFHRIVSNWCALSAFYQRSTVASQ